MNASWKSAGLALGIVAPLASGIGIGCDFYDVSANTSAALSSAVFALFPILHATFRTQGMDRKEKARVFLSKKQHINPLIVIFSGIVIFQFWEKLIGVGTGIAAQAVLPSVAPGDVPEEVLLMHGLVFTQICVNLGLLLVVFFVSRYISLRTSKYAFLFAVIAIVLSKMLSLAIMAAFAGYLPYDLKKELALQGVAMLAYAPIIAFGVWRGAIKREEFALVKAFRVLPRDDRQAILDLAENT